MGGKKRGGKKKGKGMGVGRRVHISESDSFSCLLGLLESSHGRSLFVNAPTASVMVSGLGVSP